MKTDGRMQETIAQIALEELSLDTLKIRKCGDDFTEQAVWCIKEALIRAYQAGRAAAKERLTCRSSSTYGQS